MSLPNPAPQTPHKTHPRRPTFKPSGQPPQQPWTTARCHRLLRPLLSRIASLRKDAGAATSANDLLNQTKTADIAQQGTDTGTGTECGWLKPRKRVRLTYSQKRHSRTHQDGESGPVGGRKTEGSKSSRQIERRTTSALHGEIVAPTPLLRRARGHIVHSPAPVAVPSQESGSEASKLRGRGGRGGRTRKGKDVDEHFTKLRANLPGSRHADLEAIYKSLEALLKATSAPDTPQNRGPRSFLDMCLRKVPHYIAELEAWERLEAEQSGTVTTLDEVDTSAQIYNELESLGPVKGWRHLRVVVRADGLSAVREGIAEGLFGVDFSQLLIDLCIQAGAEPEAEDLVGALVERQYPQPLTPDTSFSQLQSLKPLSCLRCFSSKTGRTSFLLRQYSLLLSYDRLPQDWLATQEFERVWSSATRDLASEAPSNDAVDFMIESIPLLFCRKRTLTGSTESVQLEKGMSESNQRTLTSALTILAAMSLLGENELYSGRLAGSDAQRVALIGERLRYILKACIAELESRQRKRVNCRNDLLYLALFLSSRRSQGDSVEVYLKRSIVHVSEQQGAPPKSRREGRTRDHHDSLVSLIASVARSCGRGTSLVSHQCLDILFQRLEILESGNGVLDNLKAAAAFLLAQQTNNVRDLIYAEKLDPHSRAHDDGNKPSGRTLFSGYRWEETIGEWVTLSPVMERRQTRKRRLRSRSSTMDVNHVETTEEFPTRPASLIRPDTRSVPDTQIDREGIYSEHSSREDTRDERVTTKKRPWHPLAETPATTQCRSRRQNSNITISDPKAASANLHDELGTDKENWDGVAVKKPRRSSGRVALSTRPRASLSSRPDSVQTDVYSDDELCI